MKINRLERDPVIDRIENDTIPDNEVVFHDGILYVIIQSGKNRMATSIKQIVISPEYDDPISLEDISNRYPDVRIVIFEDMFKGYVFNYKNHPDSEDWELVGRTIGYA